MKLGDPREAFANLGRILIIYVILRALEAVCIVISFGITSILFGPKPLSNIDASTAREVLSGSLTVVRYYYFAFGYALTSAVAFLVSWVMGFLKTAKGVATTNTLSYLAHSIAMITMVFGAALTPQLWIVWLLTAIYNGLMPARIVKAVRT